jgi:uncharacterized glyoxalase superfamily protein PhnB
MATYTLKQPIPVVFVRDLQEGIEFFEKFGFGDSWSHEGQYGGVSKDDQHIHLAKSDETKPSMIYNFVDDVDAAYEMAQEAGVEITHPIHDQFYGMRDFTTKDASGNFIAFAASIPK